MNREDDLKNLWKELRGVTEEAKEVEEADKAEAPEPKETVELDSLLSRLEDVVSRLEEALGKKEAENDAAKEESYIPRRVRRPLRDRG